MAKTRRAGGGEEGGQAVKRNTRGGAISKPKQQQQQKQQQKPQQQKQSSLTGFLVRQRKPLGEIRENNIEMTETMEPGQEEVKEIKEDIKKDIKEEIKEDIKENIKEEIKEDIKEVVKVEAEADPEMAGLCEYERIRLRNIRQREALFAELAIKEAKEDARKSAGVKAAPAGRSSVSRRISKEEDPDWQPAEPARKSLRLAGGKVPEIKRFTFEDFEYLDEELKSRKIRPEDFYLDDELVSRDTCMEEREKMLEEMATKARTFAGKTERPDGLKEVEKDRFRILHVPKKCTIKQFVLSNNLEFKCGRGFYEFTKPEIVSHKKEVVCVEKSSGSMFTGRDACRLIGAGSGMRIPPTIFETWQVFVQSTSYGRNLMGGTDFLYEV